MTPDLIERAKLGDRLARDQLVRELADPWFRFSMSLLRDQDKARDAVQETALRFLSQLGRFKGESTLRTWSLGIALNVAREIRRRRTSESLEFAPEPAGASDESSRQVEQGDLNQALRDSMSELSDRQREAVVLRFFEEMSVEETAAAMDCAVGTVKATVHQALKLLKKKLLGKI